MSMLYYLSRLPPPLLTMWKVCLFLILFIDSLTTISIFISIFFVLFFYCFYF